MKKIIISVVICFFFCVNIIAQQNVNDSLIKVLPTITADTQKIAILYELCKNQNQPESAKKYANEIIKLSITSNYKKGLIWGYNLMGSILTSEGNFNDALKYQFNVLKILNSKKDSLAAAKVNNNIGESYRLLGKYTDALTHYLKSLYALEKLNKPKLIAMSLGNIAIIYRQQKEYDKALEYNTKSLFIRNEIGDKEGSANNYDNMGIIYYQQKRYKEAVLNCLKALEIREETKDTSSLASSYNNISNIYSESGDQKRGLEYQLKALAVREHISDKRGIAMSYNNLGNIYNLTHDYKKSMSYQLKSLELSKQIGSKELLRNCYESMMTLNKNLKNYEQAFYYQELFGLVKDSMLNIETSKQITEMQTKYDSDRKEEENLLLSKDNIVKEAIIKQKTTQQNLLIFSIIAIIILSLLLYNRYKLKQKDLFQKERIKQQELRAKAIIEAEEKERTRIAQELHDGIGQQLSAVKLNMSSLQSNLQLKNEGQKLMLQNALEIIDDSVKEVRIVSHNMMPNALLKSGLATAVREFLNRISHTDKLKIELNINGLNERLENTTESILFRVLQEIVNNIIKHSKATTVNIQIIRHEQELTVMIEDNGVGFNTHNISPGIGLQNIKSRIEFLNGSLNFDSHPGKGTTVSIEIPVN